jgi:hypothetical protein
MAMGSVISVLATGSAANMQVPLSTETVLPSDDLVLHVRNASGSAVTVTVLDSSLTPAGNASANLTVSVPATTGERFIYIPQSAVNPATGLISVTFSATASVTAEWFRV